MGRTRFAVSGNAVFATPVADQPTISAESLRELASHEQIGKLTGTLTKLDALGLTDALANARDLLRQADEMRGAAAIPAARARDERAALPRRIAAGEVPLEQAAERAAALREWLPGGDGPKLANEAASVLTARAVAAARREAPAALAALAQLADTAVRDAIEAGRRIVGDATAERLLREYAGGSKPALFDLSVDRLDHAAMGAWAAASHASERFEQIVAVARELHPGSVRTTERRGTRDQVGMLDLAPRCCQLALAANSGWSPGLHTDGKPVALPEDEGMIKRMQRALVGK